MAKAGRDTLRGRLKNLERALHGEQDLGSTAIYGLEQLLDVNAEAARLEREGARPDEAQRLAWEWIGQPARRVTLAQAKAWDAVWADMTARWVKARQEWTAELGAAQVEANEATDRAQLARLGALLLPRERGGRPAEVTDEEWRRALDEAEAQHLRELERCLWRPPEDRAAEAARLSAIYEAARKHLP